MGLIVETGNGVAGANSYVSLLQADAHFSALGMTDWADMPEGAREMALIRASQHVDFYDYPGAVLTSSQGLKWPRQNAEDLESRLLFGLPYAVITAVLELAPDYLKRPELSDTAGRLIKEKVGLVEMVYSERHQRPSFVYRLLHQIGAATGGLTMVRG